MIDILAIIDKVFSAFSITKSATDLVEDVNDSESKNDSKKQKSEEIEKQRLNEVKTAREQSQYEDESQAQQKR